jgi:hypothetical protein
MPVDNRRSRDARALARAGRVGIIAALSFVSCYKPKILDGGFLCSADGVCPDGFQCGADNRCEINPVIVTPMDSGAAGSGMDAKDAKPMMSEAGGEAGACTMPTAPLCAAGPAAGDVCSPSCQRGCEGCDRCNVVDAKATCTPSGTKKLGEVCNASADNCAPGFICLLESCGNGLARCYQHCTADGQCTAPAACTIPIQDSKGNNTSFKTCDVPEQDCNPVDGSGCPDPALNCYLTNANQRLCDCQTKNVGQGGNNVPCNLYSECDQGYICIAGVNGQPTAHCHVVCDVANPACPMASSPDGGATQQVCVPAGTGAKFGYCANP